MEIHKSLLEIAAVTLISIVPYTSGCAIDDEACSAEYHRHHSLITPEPSTLALLATGVGAGAAAAAPWLYKRFRNKDK